MMPRFFFHVHDGESFIDDTGQEIASLEDARRHAARYAADLLLSDPDRFWSGEEWRMEISDHSGLVYSTLIFLSIDSPAALSHQVKKRH